ncbi:pyridoxal 5'-phosphate synthase glutaminase subunit PdxT [Lysinibacillus odysseyi]|uniref:Pyridoxal 5'-phosphate synthase subunit PdxT n=1 Tax=Lysinibacillus odysseyi 34hs-1 = NBRC 100172 TaxID=1220589 RepID=A0A0A3II34_9BACI|nr:pyridoxal 5'-phosphate synthase glutaminase subunit PdxT [Lysinibacillus odysseyi]KGR84436.1 glutamine amidotransferase [Lysinibacillus odysseyi 34hs-1 = NBRC 100172]
MKIGVLALQGAVTEHMKAIKACGAQSIAVKQGEQLKELDGLLLPGGESTAMRRLIDYAQMLPALTEFAKNKPVFGTCAGLILLAETVEGEEAHIGQMRMTARRNAFGRQVDSFETELAIEGVSDSFPAVFIRAPKIAAVENGVEVLATHEGDIVCAKDRHLLACSFHPELTGDRSLMKYFIEKMCSKQTVN